MNEVIGIDHIYIAVNDLDTSEAFYDKVFMEALGFRKNAFALAGERHIHYFNRHFGNVLRPAVIQSKHNPYSSGLHHLCFRVDSINDVKQIAEKLKSLGVEATEPKLYDEYAPDYWATFLNDPDGIRIEITNYRQESRERHDNW